MFGASGHRFALGPALSPTEVEELEARHRVALPPELRSFALEVGDGPGSPGATAGAGPGYGLYPLAAALAAAHPGAELGEGTGGASPPASEFVPTRSRAEVDEGAEGEDTNVPPGLVVLGTHGCAWDFGVALTGPYAGTVWQYVDPGWMPSTPAFEEVLDAHHGDHGPAQDWLWAHLDEVPIRTFADFWLEWFDAAQR